MSRIPSGISGKDFCAALERLGFQFVRDNKGHTVMKKPSPTGATKVAVFPNHKELLRGTIRGVLTQTETDVDDFLAAL